MSELTTSKPLGGGAPARLSPTVGKPAGAGRPAKRKSLTRKQTRAGWFLLTPALLHSTIFISIPTVAAIVLSMTDYSFTGEWQWVGFANFVELMGDQNFKTAFINTVVYAVVVVPISMGLALLIALGLNQKIRGLSFFRTAFYIPTVTATVAVASVWLWMYNPGSGLGNGILSLFGIGPQGWLTNPDMALGSVMVVGVWQGLGAKMIIYLAALQGVSRELIEAADLDGANSWQIFRHVKWPALAPAQFFVLVTAIVSTFQVFDLVYVMTQGGPGIATNVLVLDIYNNAFQSLRLGYASAETVIMILLISVFIYVGRKLQGSDKSE
ncbi:multiple sugar transport system permease protein [Arthrobacter silviterrae]|uniref:Sugar ABC transporter permease n=1 Tax=Arthrobacter silviterrae TaxID=2026658 RepID=A0ABX0DAA4_9MICC|nr:sugar ABC transporter permease [Arthrobacter silviterrae]MDQ0277012.1 multiple sugar transport system permease protein [Arthrobacter silviterrae]NGN82800.1 sugar ABC transporter permease [Arthrobacter silviterrae]